MFQGWRLKLREAEEMLRSGQLDEACRRLMQDDLRQYLPGRRLSEQLASRLTERARQQATQSHMSTAWRDLRQAARLAGEIDAVTACRQEIVALGMDAIERHLSVGDTRQAIALAESLERHDVHEEKLRRLTQVARHLDSARNLARNGKFALAESQIETAESLLPELRVLTDQRTDYQHKVEKFRQLSEAMHRAVAAEQWSDAVTLSEQLLEMAPEFRLAREIRRRAWEQVGAKLQNSAVLATTEYRAAKAEEPVREPSASPSATGVDLAQMSPDRRFLLWVDGVGGYLVCLEEELLLGQATDCGQVDIPIRADLSRRHAQICRRGDGYIIRPFQPTQINGHKIDDATLLTDGDLMQLAGTVQLRFRQPHALSASARLEFVSRHRVELPVDGILLMAESCVLGPHLQNHVVCREWQGDVVLYRRDGKLHCRAMDSIEIDGQLFRGVGQVGPNSHISGTDFSLSLEQLP